MCAIILPLLHFVKALCSLSFWHLNQTANRVLTESVNHSTISLTVSVNNRRNMLERTLF